MQSRNLLPGLTAEENVQLPMILAGRPYRDRAASLLDQVGVAPRRRALPSELSGGEAARVGLAVALALAPSVILADEPTAEVDAATEKDLVRLLSDSLRGRRDRRSSRRTARRWLGPLRGSSAFRTDGSSMTQLIVEADGLSRAFGTGGATVVALEPTDIFHRTRGAHCAPGPLGQREVDAAQSDRRARRAHRRNDFLAGHRPPSGAASARRRHDPSIRRPDPDADRRRERCAAAPPGSTKP